MEVQTTNRRDDLNSYHQNGYIVSERRLDLIWVSELAEEIERIHRDFLNLKSTCTHLVSLGEWCIKNPHLVSDKIRQFFFSNHCAEICRSLIGVDVDFYWATTGHKPPLKGRAFPWHQDSGYGQGPLEYVTLWTALDDVDEENGCIWVIPGSHKNGILEHEFRKSHEGDYGGVFLKDCPPNFSNAVPVRLLAGQTVCLDSKVIHETRLNRSLRLRRSLISAYAHPSAFANVELGSNELSAAFLRKGVKE